MNSEMPVSVAAGHRRLSEAADALDRVVADDNAIGAVLLSRTRWSFTREMMLHFAKLQRHALDPLLRDRRPEAAALAARSWDDLISITQQFERHTARWQGRVPAEHWLEYRKAIGLLTRRIRVRLAAQQHELYPLLPARPGGVPAPTVHPRHDFAADAWRIRQRIYNEQGEPIRLAQRVPAAGPRDSRNADA